MVDPVVEYLNEHRLNVENILELIDDYSIYSHYLGFEPELHTLYSSPLREGDDDPSFNLFVSKYNNDIIMFKDFASGKFGGVFKFVSLFLGFSMRETLEQINSDFDLGLGGEEKKDKFKKVVKKSILKVVKHAVSIKITAREYSKEFLGYWDLLDISVPTLKLYFTKEPILIHFESPDYKAQIVPKSLCISYEIAGHYKIYGPLGERKYKFRNNFPTNYVEGLLQFKYEKEFAIISKAMKDNMFYREHFDFDAAAGTSETNMISEHVMNTHLKGKFKRVYIMLDLDGPGIKAQQKYLDMYPWLIPITLDPMGFDVKDLTDLYREAKKVGKQQRVLDWVIKTFK